MFAIYSLLCVYNTHNYSAYLLHSRKLMEKKQILLCTKLAASWHLEEKSGVTAPPVYWPSLTSESPLPSCLRNRDPTTPPASMKNSGEGTPFNANDNIAC